MKSSWRRSYRTSSRRRAARSHSSCKTPKPRTRRACGSRIFVEPWSSAIERRRGGVEEFDPSGAKGARAGAVEKLPTNKPAHTRTLLRGLGRLQSHRSEEHTSELQSLMRNSYAVFCLKKKTKFT